MVGLNILNRISDENWPGLADPSRTTQSKASKIARFDKRNANLSNAMSWFNNVREARRRR